MFSFLSALRLYGLLFLFMIIYVPEVKSNNRGLSGCLLSLMSEVETSKSRKAKLFSWFSLKPSEEPFDSTLVSEKIYTSMISYYIEKETQFNFLDNNGAEKNFLDLNATEYAKIKEAMANDIEQSDLGDARLRTQVAKAIRNYDVPTDYREFQRRRRGSVNNE